MEGPGTRPARSKNPQRAGTFELARPSWLDRGRLGCVRLVRADLPMLCKKSLSTMFLRDGDPAAGLTDDLPLGRLHGTPRARCLPRRTIMFLELAKGPPQRGPLPASAADTARRNAGIVERLLSLLPTPCAAPSHPTDSTDREELRSFPTPLRSPLPPERPPRGPADRGASTPDRGAVDCSADDEKAKHRDERQEVATPLCDPKYEHHPSLCTDAAPTFGRRQLRIDSRWGEVAPVWPVLGGQARD